MILAKTAWRTEVVVEVQDLLRALLASPPPAHRQPPVPLWVWLEAKFWSWLLTVCLGDSVYLPAGRAPGRGGGEKGMPCCLMMAFFQVEEAAV